MLTLQQQNFITTLSPSGRRLAEFLLESGPSSTHQLRRLDIANIAECAKIINLRAEKAQVSFKVVCRRKSISNSYGGKVFVGFWEAIC